MIWRWAEGRRARADVVIDLRDRLAPYVVLHPDDDVDEPELEPAGPPAPYRPRHLAR